MNQQQWTKPVNPTEAYHRAAGRRKYNARRMQQKWQRRIAVAKVLCVYEELPHGWQQDLADRFGVHKSVISKDVAWARQVLSYEIGSGIAPKFYFRGNRLVSMTWGWG
jgi:hypothetical protein